MQTNPNAANIVNSLPAAQDTATTAASLSSFNLTLTATPRLLGLHTPQSKVIAHLLLRVKPRKDTRSTNRRTDTHTGKSSPPLIVRSSTDQITSTGSDLINLAYEVSPPSRTLLHKPRTSEWGGATSYGNINALRVVLSPSRPVICNKYFK